MAIWTVEKLRRISLSTQVEEEEGEWEEIELVDVVNFRETDKGDSHSANP